MAAVFFPSLGTHFPPQFAHGAGVFAFALAILALLGTLYALAFAITGILSGRARRYPSLPAPGSRRTRFLVFIPAHNEGSGLIPTIAGVLAQDYPQDHIQCVVIADNCTDNTAAEAGKAGAKVMVRTDPDRRGKGHALAWAFAQASEAIWDAACVIDADTILAPRFFEALDASVRGGARVIQGRYDFTPPLDSDDWLQQFTAVSKAAENSFVYRSRNRLGLLQLLQGNGFCVTRAVLDQVPWQAHSIVEDAEYALALGRHGIPIHYEERARVWSRQASTVQDVQPQRVRWASGTWQLFRRGIPSLLAAAWRQKSLRALEAIGMLLMTSRLLLIYLLALSLLSSFLATPHLAAMTWLLLALVAGLQLLYVLLMFRFAADRPEPIAGLLRLPFYVAVIGWSQVLALVGVNRRVWWRTTR